MKRIIITTVLLTIVCIAQAQSNNSQFAEVRKTIEASNAIYAELANKNDGSILTRYTDDACLYPPNSAPVCGGKNMLAFFKSGPKVHVKFTIQHLYGDPKSFVTEESFYEMADMSGNKIDEGKVIVIWKKTGAGWKMYRDMFSSNMKAKS
ncbi:YybH family protein [Hufsiella arboris]|uniref:YybH family protein n=1 Tax=Hufsiella arboris TaxID=2695275 RepID=UPI0019279E3D|nr:hypothetical protein [Hufsiella arboris]